MELLWSLLSVCSAYSSCEKQVFQINGDFSWSKSLEYKSLALSLEPKLGGGGRCRLSPSSPRTLLPSSPYRCLSAAVVSSQRRRGAVWLGTFGGLIGFLLTSLFTGSFLGSTNAWVHDDWSGLGSHGGGPPAASSILHATPPDSCRRCLLMAPPAFYLFPLLICRRFILLR